MKTLDQYWYSKNLVARLLLPLSWCFRALTVIRKWLYDIGLFRSVRLPVPVIVVGNIAVGGTGKTPLLIALCELLKTSGHRPGVISRGYASNLKGEALVHADSTAADVGDEPLLIARRTGSPVAVGRCRPAAAALLLKNYDCDIILSDDGLQHYALQRDIEIAVVDALRMHGNGYFIPAGPLRESVRRLESVDLVVYNGSLASPYNFVLECSMTINLTTGTSAQLKTLAGQTVHAVAGIGNPQRFFEQLKSEGLDVIAHAFPDHHSYIVGDLTFNDALPILMTEKDAVKCTQLKPDRCWSVPVAARLSPQLITDFHDCIKRLVGGVNKT